VSKTIELSEKELRKLHVIKQLSEGKLRQVEAAESLSLSSRQVRRLLIRYRDQGTEGFSHKLRGIASNHQLDKALKDKVVKLVKEKYPDFGPTFASEKLQGLDSISINPETLRLLMIQQGMWQNKQRKKPVHRTRRPRKPCYGDMEQFDGSYHDWFEGRYNGGEYTTLLASIDDATGKINAWFSDYEGTVPVMKFWWRYFVKYGKPHSIYLDRHSTYKVNTKNALDDDTVVSQFTRAMTELGVKVLNANTPQAKGRVERLFGTLQDRLVKELRLAGINNPNDANRFLQAYLPKFNAKFNVEAVSNTDTHVVLSKQDDLTSILSVQSIRIVSRDFVVSFKNHWYQLNKQQSTTVYPNSKVIIEERLDNTVHLRLNGKYLSYTKLDSQPPKLKRPITALAPEPRKELKVKSVTKPSANHPWRKFRLLPYNITNRPNQKDPSKKWS
jgi:transposase